MQYPYNTGPGDKEEQKDPENIPAEILKKFPTPSKFKK
jgi:hypothetical protein